MLMRLTVKCGKSLAVFWCAWVFLGCNVNYGQQNFQAVVYSATDAPENEEVAFVEAEDGSVSVVESGQLSPGDAFTGFRIIDLVFHLDEYDWEQDYSIELLLQNSGTTVITEIGLICKIYWYNSISYETLNINDAIEPDFLFAWTSPAGSNGLARPGEVNSASLPDIIEILQAVVNGILIDLPTQFQFAPNSGASTN